MKPETESIFDSWTAAVDKKQEERRSERVEPEPEVIRPELEFRADELSPIIEALGGAFTRSTEVKPLEDSDVRDISHALAPVLTKHMGHAWEQWAGEIALLAVLLKVTLPRYKEFSDRRAQEDAEESVSMETVPEGEF